MTLNSIYAIMHNSRDVNFNGNNKAQIVSALKDPHLTAELFHLLQTIKIIIISYFWSTQNQLRHSSFILRNLIIFLKFDYHFFLGIPFIFLCLLFVSLRFDHCKNYPFKIRS